MERDPGQEVRNLWQFVNGLERRLNRRHVMNLVLIGVVWLSTIAVGVVMHNKLEDLSKKDQELSQELGRQYGTITDRVVVADEDRKVVAAALRPNLTLAECESHYASWNVVKTFKRFRVVCLRPGKGCAVELSDYLADGEDAHLMTWQYADGKADHFYVGPPVDSGGLDRYVRLDDASFARVENERITTIGKSSEENK